MALLPKVLAPRGVEITRRGWSGSALMLAWHETGGAAALKAVKAGWWVALVESSWPDIQRFSKVVFFRGGLNFF